MKEALGRPVWRHEFGFNVDGLIQEFLNERDAPTLEDILSLVPPCKAQGVFVEEQAY